MKTYVFGRYVSAALVVVVMWMTLGSAKAVNDMAVDPVIGYWLTEKGDGVIALYACGDHICGKFHWLKDDSPSDVSRDEKNPDPDRRGRPLCEQQFMGDFTPTPPNRYEGGWIYSPRSGSTYSARMTLVDHDTLDVHGYVMTPLLGESQRWKRAPADPACITSGL